MQILTTSHGQIPIPERWDEIPGETIPKLIEHRFNWHLIDEDGHRAKQRLAILHYLTGIPAKNFARLPDTELYDLLRRTDWVVNTRLDCRPFPYFTYKGVEYYLPAPKLADTSSGELSMANLYYLAYSRPQNADYNAVYSLIATLCRPRRWDYLIRRFGTDYAGDDRQPYNSLRIDKAARHFAKGLPMGTIMAVLQYFECLLDEFMARYQDVFEGDEGTRPLFQNGEGWLALLEDVAENAPFGDYDAVFSQNCHTVWMYLRHKKLKVDREREEYERQAEEQKTHD